MTPVNVQNFKKLLEQSEYNAEKTAWVIDGFTNGFSLGYQGNQDVQITSQNLKLRVGSKTVLWNKVMKEVKLKRFAGPFTSVPFKNFIQSPIGLVPKDNGKDVRLIFHLSYPRGRGISVNQNTPQEWCSVKYPEFDAAVKMCARAGRKCSIAKSDFSAAFRNVPMKICDICYLIMKAESPFDHKIYYFVDKCLPFGASISCSHFQEISNAIAHIVRFKTKEDLINYLDDFLFAALLRSWCDGQVRIFLQICEEIQFPVSQEKTFWSCTILVFLGLLIDTVNQVISVPREKIDKALKLINEIIGKKKITLKQLQSICGFLNFLGRAIVPGRAFTRRLYMFTKGKISTGKLKPHHHIRVTTEMRADLMMWQQFLRDEPSVYCRGFLDFDSIINADQIQMYSDASRNWTLGVGGICQNSWFYTQWDRTFMEKVTPSIEYLELFGVVATALNWLGRFTNRRVVLFCDNQSVVHMVNKTTSSCPNCLALIRILVLHCMKINVRLFAKYLTSKQNKNADLLSRMRIQQFKQQSDSWDEAQTGVPDKMWPIQKIWIHSKN